MVTKVTLEWVMQPDGSKALVFDKNTWALFEEVARDKGKDARHMISSAVLQCLGAVMADNYMLNRILKSD